MLAKHAASAILCTLSLAIAGCGQERATQDPAGVPVSASPTPAPGVSREELETREAVSVLGNAARDLEQAQDLGAAREAVGTIERRLSEHKAELPENIAGSFEAALKEAREALVADNLAAARAAGQLMINSVLTSEQIQDPNLIRPGEPG